MQLTINGKPILPEKDQSLQSMICQLDMDSDKLSERPLAARIAGEVFTLNYIPVRSKDENLADRKAITASCGEIKLLRYSDPAGKKVYTRSCLFLVFLAMRQLWADAVGQVSCTLGNSVYISVSGAKTFSVSELKSRMMELKQLNFPMIRRRVPIADAIENYRQQGQEDKARLLSWHSLNYFDEYFYEDYADYFYGEMVPSSGYLSVWDVLPADGGFILVYPNDSNPDQLSDFYAMPHFFEVFSEGENWCRLMECQTAADLNELTASTKIRELIRVNEALHEKRFSQVADLVCSRGAKIVMLAGPSSSGKTTSANRLATQLRVHGKKPILFSLDDYYLDRDTITPGPDGKIDLENINTIDTELFRRHMTLLLAGEEIECPVFNFVTGKREWQNHRLELNENSVIIMEGIHGLNPVLLPEGIADNLVFRLYVSPLLPLNLDNHNRIPTSYLRLLRRIVRDYENRGASVQHTISMWESVQRGEKLWIFPFQENADIIFNSSTLYELAVLKKHIYPLLIAIAPEDPCFDEVRSIISILSFIQEADVDDEIPPTSLVREFIGGNKFYS